ncbi:hypothetical protein GCM10011349_13690 [Novosphingobium indicum]|jgi:hypothetical protein|uniref:HTH merR-type domain-containing protein n=2 Tax=Novosphingobium indicum TaxID=462949 RepID=A0ABQ2JHC8_9SPHN|nr:hypothetical protein GCM10011349_13690 [Novosphingobium indicum]
MLYTQSQIRELLSISVDALRTWRDAIPALTAHKGHAPSFTPGDVVAMAIIAELIKDFGMRVGTVGDRFDQLLNECHGRSWLSLEACAVLIGAESISLVDAGAPSRPSPDSSTLYVPCRQIVSRLRSALTANEAELAQGYLQFPPTAIGSQTERRGRRA